MTEEKKDLTGLFRDQPGTPEGRPVLDFPGYRVGDDGSVWSCWKKICLGIGKGTASILSDEWVRKKPTVNCRSGYLQVMLHRHGKKHLRAVHRLVLEAFVGPCPEGMEGCHYPDRNKRNCRRTNLIWDTRKNNHAHKREHGTLLFGESHYASKLTNRMVRKIRKLALHEKSFTKIARMVGFSEGAVRSVVKGLSWSHVK